MTEKQNELPLDDERRDVAEELKEVFPEGVMLLDGFNDCVIGIAHRCGSPEVIAYDLDKIQAKLVERDGMTEEEASEWISFNIVGAYVGETTPVYIQTIQLP
jgi:hypothetical protein